MSLLNWRQKRAARAFQFNLFLSVILHICYIPHNSAIPQAMSHAIPQTHSSFYPYRVNVRGMSKQAETSSKETRRIRSFNWQPCPPLTDLLVWKISAESGKGKRRNEFAKWHVAWLAEWHNYAECNICRMTERNKLNWKACPFLAPNKEARNSFFCPRDVWIKYELSIR